MRAIISHFKVGICMSLHFVVLCDISMCAYILFVIFDRIISDANFRYISDYENLGRVYPLAQDPS